MFLHLRGVRIDPTARSHRVPSAATAEGAHERDLYSGSAAGQIGEHGHCGVIAVQCRVSKIASSVAGCGDRLALDTSVCNAGPECPNAHPAGSGCWGAALIERGKVETERWLCRDIDRAVWGRIAAGIRLLVCPVDSANARHFSDNDAAAIRTRPVRD